jgi:osmotically-inducible protein OsmY
MASTRLNRIDPHTVMETRAASRAGLQLELTPDGSHRRRSMNSRTAEIERRIEQAAEVNVLLEEQDDRVIVTGLVADDAEHDMVLGIVRELVTDKHVEDNLEVTGLVPETVTEEQLPEAESEAVETIEAGITPDRSMEPGDFTSQATIRDPAAASGPNNTRADDDVQEGEAVFVPPTDPVRRQDNEVLGGYAPSSWQSKVERSVSDGEIGDEALADAVRRELEEDAATSGLEIRVSVRNGVALLRGRVRDLDDAENAEEVAARVQGVREVREELEVADLE